MQGAFPLKLHNRGPEATKEGTKKVGLDQFTFGVGRRGKCNIPPKCHGGGDGGPNRASLKGAKGKGTGRGESTMGKNDNEHLSRKKNRQRIL